MCEMRLLVIRLLHALVVGGHPYQNLDRAIKRPRTRSAAVRQVSNALERDLVTNQNV